tara:strand:+ start:272 stop:523 length:252 start_codon:yes stop_codon:yes gene_type:complete
MSVYREIHKAIFDLNVDHVGRSRDHCHPWRMRKLILLLVVSASIWAGIALNRAGWKYRKQLWQFQGAATGLIAGYLLGSSMLI